MELFLFIDGGLHREMRRVQFFGVTPVGLLGFLCSTHRLPPACGRSGLLHKTVAGNLSIHGGKSAFNDLPYIV